MRIVIDLQGAQGTNQPRGIGRYSLSLARAMARNRGDHEIIVALNGRLAESIDAIRAAFDGLLPRQNIRVWDAPGPVAAHDADNGWLRQTAELVREVFIASLNPDIVLLTSLFEGFVDDAVTSIGALDRDDFRLTQPTAVVLYDLIPLIYRDLYLQDPAFESWYENKLGHMRRAGLLLCISQATQQDAMRHLGLAKAAVVNISGAVDARFKAVSVSEERGAELQEKYGLKRPFVMYTGGIDHRKNIEGLIRAYARLPPEIRGGHQLAIICSVQLDVEVGLEKLAGEHGLSKGDLILTGFVPDENLPALYSLCKVFVFPSLYEGFGLPALEAMSCGRAVIGSNTSSIPEVIGREDALFDPHSDEAIARKLEQVLGDDAFRRELERHGLKQAKKFSWDKSARAALRAVEKFHAGHRRSRSAQAPAGTHPRLAYVSPLPPQRSGISDYSADLLPELARHYDIDVIVAQDTVTDPWVRANCAVRDVAWLRANRARYDRVLYHFGNSHFHAHMFDLLEDVPGVVVLHDFFLSGVVAHRDVLGEAPDSWARTLYLDHGYQALRQRFHTADSADTIWKYPCSLEVARRATGVIVHSENSRKLARHWYGGDDADIWAVVPLLRGPVRRQDKAAARQAVGLDTRAFVICSFGMLGKSKLNHRLLEAWLKSGLAEDKNCHLIFVGENPVSDYGRDMLAAIKKSGRARQVRITGWADGATYRNYLAAADMAVQLRTLSRGETSAAVLDCMNYGLPTIVNANGSMADLVDGAVCKLPDAFSTNALSEALEALWRDSSTRRSLADVALHTVKTHHAPETCADQYHEAIEAFYSRAECDLPALARAIARVVARGGPDAGGPADLVALARDVAGSIPPRFAPRQLLVDISELVQRDARSGIQRVVRNILRQWLNAPPTGLRVEPVYATAEAGYHYARHFMLGLLDCPPDILEDDPVEFYAGDIFVGLDLQPLVVAARRDFYRRMRQRGVAVKFLVYDLLPIVLPHCFVDGAADMHERWLRVVAESDGAICISKAGADELADWLKTQDIERSRPLEISWFHLGADLAKSVPDGSAPDDADAILKQIGSRASFLMLGTVEPRKGHAQTLAAFEQLWADGSDVNLVIVGKQGWLVEDLVDRLRAHPQRGRRLFWLEGVSDAYLERLYTAATCLIAASMGEGFGLPLIEAARNKLPILARDIPVFREVAGDHAYYFTGDEPSDLALAIDEWQELCKANRHPAIDGLVWLTWEQSANSLLALLTQSGEA